MTRFMILTLASAWIPALWFWWSGADLGWQQSGQTAWLLAALPLGPGLAAILASWAGRRKPISLPPLQFHPMILLSMVLFPALALTAAGLSVFLGWAQWDWSMSSVQQDLIARGIADPLPLLPYTGVLVWGMALVAGPLLWFLPGLAEEYAWREWLPEASGSSGFWQQALLAGGLWWLWKLPLFWQGYQYPSRSLSGIAVGLGFALTTSALLTSLRQTSGGLLAPALARATLYSSAAMPLAVTEFYNPVYAHLNGCSGVLVLSLALLAGWLLGLLPPGFAGRTKKNRG